MPSVFYFVDVFGARSLCLRRGLVFISFHRLNIDHRRGTRLDALKRSIAVHSVLTAIYGHSQVITSSLPFAAGDLESGWSGDRGTFRGGLIPPV